MKIGSVIIEDKPKIPATKISPDTKGPNPPRRPAPPITPMRRQK